MNRYKFIFGPSYNEGGWCNGVKRFLYYFSFPPPPPPLFYILLQIFHLHLLLSQSSAPFLPPFKRRITSKSPFPCRFRHLIERDSLDGQRRPDAPFLELPQFSRRRSDDFFVDDLGQNGDPRTLLHSQRSRQNQNIRSRVLRQRAGPLGWENDEEPERTGNVNWMVKWLSLEYSIRYKIPRDHLSLFLYRLHRDRDYWVDFREQGSGVYSEEIGPTIPPLIPHQRIVKQRLAYCR